MSQVLAQHVLTSVQASGGDIFSIAQGWSNSAKTTAKIIAGALAIIFVIIIAIKEHTLGKVVGALIVGGVFFWGVNHITSSTVQDPISNTVDGQNNGAPAPGVTFHPPAA